MHGDARRERLPALDLLEVLVEPLRRLALVEVAGRAPPRRPGPARGPGCPAPARRRRRHGRPAAPAWAARPGPPRPAGRWATGRAWRTTGRAWPASRPPASPWPSGPSRRPPAQRPARPRRRRRTASRPARPTPARPRGRAPARAGDGSGESCEHRLLAREDDPVGQPLAGRGLAGEVDAEHARRWSRTRRWRWRPRGSARRGRRVRSASCGTWAGSVNEYASRPPGVSSGLRPAHQASYPSSGCDHVVSTAEAASTTSSRWAAATSGAMSATSAFLSPSSAGSSPTRRSPKTIRTTTVASSATARAAPPNLVSGLAGAGAALRAPALTAGPRR